ncbi:hypothetical protein ANTRET_LOCUS1049 [Anthophora retusa]
MVSLLLQGSLSNCKTSNRSKQFHEAVEYWTDALCILHETKTFVFHGIFVNSTETLRDFFDILLQTTSNYCNAIVLPKIYAKANFHQERTLNTVNLNTRQNNVITKGYTRIEEYNVVKRQAIWSLVSMLNVLHHKWNITAELRRKEEYYIDMWTVNVIFLGDSESFEKLLLSETLFHWNSREHFIVLAVWNDLSEVLKDRRLSIDRTLRKLWLEYHIQNVLFDEPLSRHQDSTLYTYDPFAVTGEGRWGQLECVDGTSKRRMLRLLSSLTYQRTVNFNGYRFNVSIYNHEQEETRIRDKINPRSVYVYSEEYNEPSGTLLNVLAKKLNFTVNAIKPNTEEVYGHRMENATFNGAVGDVAYRRVVASFASFFVKRYADDMSRIEFTATVDFDQVCVIVPRAEKIPKDLRMFYTFQPFLWLCILVSYIMVYLTRYYARIFSPRVSKNAKQTTFHVFSISQSSTISEKCLLLSIFLSGITLVGIFNGILYKSITTDMFYNDINSLAELDASDLPVGFVSYSTMNVFGTKDEADLSPVWKRLQTKMIHVSEVMKTVAFHRNISGLLRDQYFTSIYESLIDATGTHMLHRVTECPARFYLACLLPSNSFLRERINIVIDRLNEGGLLTLWRKRTILDHATRMKINIRKERKQQMQKTFVPFQLRDVQICFLILGTGLFSSTVVFFHEKGWLRLRSRKRAKRPTGK